MRNSDCTDLAAWFGRLLGEASRSPHAWQLDLASAGECPNRLIRIPTGFGKTLGVLGTWLWNRVHCRDESWPRRLVWCLPMRVLVEQTEAEARAALKRLDLFWDGTGSHEATVGVHTLMGGSDPGDWALHPEHCAILIGTQDMLLSRAMNRGYGAPRARWPMEFGLLNQDCLWVMDEVQLMDVGLATSAQLQAFRQDDDHRQRSIRPCRTWWMSATLQEQWLLQSPEGGTLFDRIAPTRIPPAQRSGRLWDDVTKPMRVQAVGDEKAFARLIATEHLAHGRGAAGPTLVVVNTVRDCVALHALLASDPAISGTELRLVHSRFRPIERAGWREGFLNRGACAPGTDRIVIATQVIEAGVDLSAALLITALAPWASLVQRFGRAARWGGSASVIVIDRLPENSTALDEKQRKALQKQQLPYALEELEAARDALSRITDVSPGQLEAFEEQHHELLSHLYPYSARHLLLRHELDDLFDTAPDLSGADIDVSRFIRSGDERDLQVFWMDVGKDQRQPSEKVSATREALCAVPFLEARTWLCGKESGSSKSPRLREKMRAWVWDYLDGAWRVAERRDLYPGQTVLVDSKCGGYLPDLGWAPDSKTPVTPVAGQAQQTEYAADASEDDEALSAAHWQTIATHGAQVGTEACAIARDLGLSSTGLLDLAGRWHDTGKALSPFQRSIADGPARPQRMDLAKAPREAWVAASKLYPDPPRDRRRGFRHELASTLALFAVLMRHEPTHPALLGPWREWLDTVGLTTSPQLENPAPPNALEQEVLDLSAEDFDLLAYLVCSHHGKVRLAWHASPADQQANDSVLRLRGVRQGDELPPLEMFDRDRRSVMLPSSELRLDAAAAGLNPVTGRGWTERVLGLLDRHGTFALAYLEALLRAADQRASRAPIADPLLEGHNADHGLETSHRNLAEAPVGRESPAEMDAHSPQRRAEHGLRGRAGEPGEPGSATRAPAHATRYVETTRGRLSYAELAPLLAATVLLIEQDIERGCFDERALDDALIVDLHKRLCADLIPSIAGWRRTDVVIGGHEPPEHFRVPLLMREYARDLRARLDHALVDKDLQLEALAFAEGRLLSIHPFADFNGRVTRLFLRLLLRRLDLPAVDLLPSLQGTRAYLDALAAGDHLNWQPLASIWSQRLQTEDTP